MSNLGLLYFWLMHRHTFKKAERLTNKKTFDLLFEKGKSFAMPPFRLVWIERKVEGWKDGIAEVPIAIGRETTTPSTFQPSNLPTFQCGISVPKKFFARAIDRNTLKRRIREAYRKNKHLLYEVLHRRYVGFHSFGGNPQNKNHSLALMIIYTAKEQLPYSEIEKKMVVSLQKLIKQVVSC